MNKEYLRRPVLIILVIFGWFALLSQLYLILDNRQSSIVATVVNFFSFFTILTNLIVALCSTALLSTAQNNLTTPKTITAIAVYITIVGMVYNLILRFAWAPQGLQKVTDELLHTAIPVLFVTYWLVYVNKASLHWKDAFPGSFIHLCILYIRSFMEQFRTGIHIPSSIRIR